MRRKRYVYKENMDIRRDQPGRTCLDQIENVLKKAGEWEE